MSHKCLSSSEILKRHPELTYRQLDYWTTGGLASCHRHFDRDRTGDPVPGRDGSGRPAFWDVEEVEVIAFAARIIARLQCGASVAFILARTGRVDIDGGEVVVRDVDPSQ